MTFYCVEYINEQKLILPGSLTLSPSYVVYDYFAPHPSEMHFQDYSTLCGKLMISVATSSNCRN
jgi:hypothetical protein